MVQVLIPKYGIEGTLFLRRAGADKNGKEDNDGSIFIFDEEVPSQVGPISLRDTSHVFLWAPQLQLSGI